MERDRVYLPKNPSLPTVPSQLATLPCFFAILERSFDHHQRPGCAHLGQPFL